MVFISPRLLVALVPLACNPAPPVGEPGTSTGLGPATEGVSWSSSVATPTTAIGTSTDGAGSVTTMSGETTMVLPSPTSWTSVGDETTAGFVCNWHSDPDAEVFCPVAAVANADLSGTTPLGPIAFKFAYFGLYACAECPYAVEGSLVFFGEPGGPAQPQADQLFVTNGVVRTVALSVGGKEVGFDAFDEAISVVFMDVDVPSVAETNPPLDVDAPPTLSGTLVIVGGGWDVTGEFTATLCRSVDPQVSCE